MSDAAAPAAATVPAPPRELAAIPAPAATGFGGWAELQRALNVTVPAYLDDAERLLAGVLRGR